jgi:hypothetical protein
MAAGMGKAVDLAMTNFMGFNHNYSTEDHAARKQALDLLSNIFPALSELQKAREAVAIQMGLPVPDPPPSTSNIINLTLSSSSIPTPASTTPCVINQSTININTNKKRGRPKRTDALIQAPKPAAITILPDLNEVNMVERFMHANDAGRRAVVENMLKNIETDLTSEIGMGIMTKAPVILCDCGKSFEKDEIEKWREIEKKNYSWRKKDVLCPNCKQPITNNKAYNNLNLKNIACEFELLKCVVDDYFSRLKVEAPAPNEKEEAVASTKPNKKAKKAAPEVISLLDE